MLFVVIPTCALSGCISWLNAYLSSPEYCWHLLRQEVVPTHKVRHMILPEQYFYCGICSFWHVTMFVCVSVFRLFPFFTQLIWCDFRSRVWKAMKNLMHFSFGENRQSLEFSIIIISSGLKFPFQKIFALCMMCFTENFVVTKLATSTALMLLFSALCAVARCRIFV